MIKHILGRFTKLQNNPISIDTGLAAITLITALLQFYKLGEWSFWEDEIFIVGAGK